MLKNKILQTKNGIVTFEVLYKKNIPFRAYMDEEDFHRLPNVKVSFKDKRKSYLRCVIDGKQQYLHRLVMNATTNDIQLDHIDSNPLNNCKSNLRYATQQENLANRKIKSSLPKGVIKSGKNFKARIQINSKKIDLGTYKSAIEAQTAYYVFAKNCFKGFLKA